MLPNSNLNADNKATNNGLDSDVPEGRVQDDSYVRANQEHEPVPVQKDDAAVDESANIRDPDSDLQLEQDDKDAIDQANTMSERTRGAKPQGQYEEPSDAKLGLTD